MTPVATTRSLRGELNHRYARFRARQARRARRPERTLVLADHWSGSVQQFYHFLLGYLGPLATYAQAHPRERLWMRDCGPMRPWIEAIRPDVDVDTVSVGYALGLMIRSRGHVRVVEGLDDPARFRRRALLGAAHSVRWLLDVDPAPLAGSPRIVVVDRQVTDPFYRSEASETEMGGRERRSTPRLPETIAGLPFAETAGVVELTGMVPGDQVRLFSHATAIIAQHGAGLAHMLWMPRGSTVLEIQPPLVPGVDHIFRELATELGHTYVRVPQAELHAAVARDDLVRAAAGAGLLAG